MRSVETSKLRVNCSIYRGIPWREDSHHATAQRRAGILFSHFDPISLSCSV
jgi:hypothetical protein